jgi:hypothetical protein
VGKSIQVCSKISAEQPPAPPINCNFLVSSYHVHHPVAHVLTISHEAKKHRHGFCYPIQYYDTHADGYTYSQMFILAMVQTANMGRMIAH